MPATHKTMTCMEIWGGCDAIDNAVTLSGLDAWVYSRPFEQGAAGGDVYYVSACATGRINRLLVADVAGHGEGMRAIAITLRDLMRRYVNFIDQSRFVLSMNRQFVESSHAGIFATAVVLTFFAPTRTLSICNAGHPQPLLYTASRNEWSLLDLEEQGHRVANLPLGIVDLDNCEQFNIDLEVGDLVLVYTDSLIEARTPEGQMLGVEGLLQLVKDTAHTATPRDPQTFINTLLQSVDEKTAGGLAADDVTALLLRPNGAITAAKWKDVLLTPIRLTRNFAQALAGKTVFALPEFSLTNIGGALCSPLNRLGRKRNQTPP